MMRDSFIFYGSWYEAIKSFPAEVQGEIYTAIMEYSLYGKETHDMGKIASAIWTLIRPQVDANRARYENGCKGAKHGIKGGRPSRNNNPNETPRKPLNNPNETPNDNVYVNENDLLEKKELNKFNSQKKKFLKPSIEDIRDYCLEKQYAVDPELFYSFYESKGWMVGSNPMKDWKAALSTWERKNAENYDNKSAFQELKTGGERKLSTFEKNMLAKQESDLILKKMFENE
jgi:hypothetical protein